MKCNIKRLCCLFVVIVFCFSFFIITNAVSGGTCGTNVTWEYNSDNKVLTINGEGAMDSYRAYNYTPWWYFNEEIEKIIIKDGVTNIGTCAFSWMFNLKSVEIPESVIYIYNYAFGKCKNLSNIDLPSNLQKIGVNVFDETAIYNNQNNWESGNLYVDNYLIESMNPSTYVEIRDGIALIADNAFEDCIQIVKVIVPDSVRYIGDEAFSGCGNLTEFEFLGSKITEIGRKAFNDCSSLFEIKIPKGVVKLYDYTFSDCNNLSKILLPDTLNEIEPATFAMCRSLDVVYYEGSEEQWNKVTGADFTYNIYGEQFRKVIFNCSNEYETNDETTSSNSSNSSENVNDSQYSTNSIVYLIVGLAITVIVISGGVFINKRKKNHTM